MKTLRERKYLLFDLDGTLSDSAPGIVASVAYALDKMGYSYENLEALRRFVGPPLREEFMDYCKISRDEGDMAVEAYREYYTVKGIYENSPYDGVCEMLRKLAASGKILAVATSKPEKFARIIIDGYGFTESFAYIGGSELNGDRTDKADVIKYVMEKLDASPDDCVMIGDRKHDIIGGKKLGILTVGVLWGYGDREELEDSRADAVCSFPDELCGMLC